MNSTTELLVVGTGGLAKEAAQLARQIDPHQKKWNAIKYVTQDPSELGSDLPYGSVHYLDQHLLQIDTCQDVVIAIGTPEVRQQVAGRLISNARLRFPNLIHPSVEIDARHVTLGRGNMITRGVVMTCSISVGDFNLFNWNCTIGHDVTIGSFNVVNPSANISGCVTIGDKCLVGVGSQILERLSIGSCVRIGAGAVVTKSITERGATVIGVPARQAPR